MRAKHHEIHVFVGLPVVVLTAYHDVLVRDVEIYADMEEITLVLVLMFEFQRNPATDDVVAELLQFRRFIADSRLYGIRVGEAAKRNL